MAGTEKRGCLVNLLNGLKHKQCGIFVKQRSGSLILRYNGE